VKYLATHHGSLEQSTLDGIETHFNHLSDAQRRIPIFSRLSTLILSGR
jgi:hypothetical protein